MLNLCCDSGSVAPLGITKGVRLKGSQMKKLGKKCVAQATRPKTKRKLQRKQLGVQRFSLSDDRVRGFPGAASDFLRSWWPQRVIVLFPAGHAWLKAHQTDGPKRSFSDS